MARQNLIEEQNKKQAARAQKILSNSKDPFAVYKTQLADNQKFEMTFPMSDTEGNLYFIDDNKIKVVLPMNALQETDRYYARELRGNYVGIKTLEVLINSIDEENKTVYLKSGRTTENIVQAIRRALFKEVHERYEKKKNGEVLIPYPVYGTIDSVDAERQNATVRLFNQNIYATIHISKWCKSYIRTIPEGVEDSDCPMKFDLIGTAQVNGKKYFRLSGENYREDAWADIPKEIFEKGALIAVKCIEKPMDKNHWWGTCEGFDVELLGNYTDKFAIEEGRTYLCTVKKTGSNTLIVTPFKYLREKGESKEDVAYLTKEDVQNLYREKKKAANAAKLTDDAVNNTAE